MDSIDSLIRLLEQIRKLPESEQEKILYIAKGMELANKCRTDEAQKGA